MDQEQKWVDFEHTELTREIIAGAIDVHRELGPGLLESAYEACSRMSSYDAACRCADSLNFRSSSKANRWTRDFGLICSCLTR